MTIAEARTSCKAFAARVQGRLQHIPKDALVVLVLLLASSASFGLGILAGHSSIGSESGEGITTSQTPQIQAAVPSVAGAEEGQVVASKNGTKYYISTCSGAARIAAANKVYFATAAAAQAAGYTPAANCKAP